MAFHHLFNARIRSAYLPVCVIVGSFIFAPAFQSVATAQDFPPAGDVSNPVAALPEAPVENAEAKETAVADAPQAEKETKTPAAPQEASPAPVAPRVTSPATVPTRTAPTSSGDWEMLEQPRKIESTQSGPTVRPTPAWSTPEAPLSGASLGEIAAQMKLAMPLPRGRVVIDKSARRLDLLSGNTLVKSYSIALGRDPIGHKARQGDGRTPEGQFYICTRNTKTSAFHIFLGLSYPALPDAKRAVRSKQITWREYQIINQKLAARGRPPWETKLGGWVGIHGGTDARYAQKKIRETGSRDWTAGCIGLTDSEIQEIYAATKLGTPVSIQP